MHFSKRIVSLISLFTILIISSVVSLLITEPLLNPYCLKDLLSLKASQLSYLLNDTILFSLNNFAKIDHEDKKKKKKKRYHCFHK